MKKLLEDGFNYKTLTEELNMKKFIRFKKYKEIICPKEKLR